MLKAGLGIAGLLIIVFSTVTTTFLDAYSAGISSETVVSKWNGKHVAIVVTVIGTIAAIVYPMDNITDFLYLIEMCIRDSRQTARAGSEAERSGGGL